MYVPQIREAASVCSEAAWGLKLKLLILPGPQKLFNGLRVGVRGSDTVMMSGVPHLLSPVGLHLLGTPTTATPSWLFSSVPLAHSMASCPCPHVQAKNEDGSSTHCWVCSFSSLGCPRSARG